MAGGGTSGRFRLAVTAGWPPAIDPGSREVPAPGVKTELPDVCVLVNLVASRAVKLQFLTGWTGCGCGHLAARIDQRPSLADQRWVPRTSPGLGDQAEHTPQRHGGLGRILDR
jgi:hypothetical protein